jgi:predicted nucleotidyltransferase
MKSAWPPWKTSDETIIGGSTVLNQDFREFIQSLNDNHVRYLVIGGYAVAFHGHPRYTKDIDIWIDPSPTNAARMVKALDQFGFGSLGLQAADFVAPDQIVQLGYPPNRIDLLTSASGVDFKRCYRARVRVEVDGVSVNFIDLDNLKKNKTAAGRLQDLADLENLR